MTTQAVTHPARRARERTAVRAGGPRLVPLMLFVVAVVAVFFLMIFLRIALDRSAFELESVERQITQAESRQLDLRLELAQLQDPLRIANEATRMGMTYPAQRVPVVVAGLGQDAAPAIVERPLQALDIPQP